MKILEGRRLAAVFAAYVGLFSAYVLLPNVRKYVFAIGIMAFLLFTGILLFPKKGQKFSVRKMILIVLMLISVVSACARSEAYAEKTDVTAKVYANGEVYAAEGQITKVLYEEDYGSAYELQLFKLDGKDVDFGLALTMYQNGELPVGTKIRFQGEMNEISGTYEIYRKADGIFLSSEADDFEVIGTEEEKLTFIENIRLNLKKNFENYLSEKSAGFACALVMGDRENLDNGIRHAYSRLGISHILAVSGLHLTIIIGGLGWILTQFHIPKKLRSLFLIAGAFFFAWLCGFSASIVRAAVMLTFFYLADMVGERHDSSTSLFLAIFLLVCFRPNAVYDVGMWLSFFATLGILAVMPVLSAVSVTRKNKFYRLWKIGMYFVSLIFMSLAATFFTLPVIWIAFGGISLFAPISNLIFVPLTQLILYLLVGLTVFGGFPWLASKIAFVIENLSAFSENLAEKLSNLEDIYISLRYPFVPYLLIFLTVGILTVLLIRKIRPSWIFAVFAIFMIGFGVSYGEYMEMNREISFVYLETDGKSDAVGFFSDGKSMIVDVSTGGGALYREISERLGDFCEAELDVLVLTHYHRYHVGTLKKLMNNVKIHKILLPEPTTEQEKEYFDRICSVISENATIEIYQTDGTATETIGEITLYLPEKEYLKRSTHPLICFSADIGEEGKGFSYLGSGATETDFSQDVRSVTVIGTHGPSMKNIFDATPMENAEMVIFSEKAMSDWTETERISEKTVYAEDYGGYIRIMFE